MNDELRREVERWLRFAEEDLQEAERLTGQPETVPRHPAWLAHPQSTSSLRSGRSRPPRKRSPDDSSSDE